MDLKLLYINAVCGGKLPSRFEHKFSKRGLIEYTESEHSISVHWVKSKLGEFSKENVLEIYLKLNGE